MTRPIRPGNRSGPGRSPRGSDAQGRKLTALARSAPLRHSSAAMPSIPSPDDPESCQRIAVPLDLASVLAALQDLASNHFFVRYDGGDLHYQASPSAVATHGHPAIESALLRVLVHETGALREVNVDAVGAPGDPGSLVIVRTLRTADIFVLTAAEYARQLGLPMPHVPEASE